jgi:L-methionine (R)-S-oxide reductase
MNPSAQYRALIRELAGFQISGPFEDNLYRLTCIVGELVAARRVSLMLLDTGHGKGARLKLSALYGELPEIAWKEEPTPGQGIAGQVLLTGRCIRVVDIGHSPWKATARRPADGGGFMACPIVLAGEPAGVINISVPIERKAFTTADLETAELAAPLIARIIQVTRLERILDSRFAQMAFTLEGNASAYTFTALSAHDPDRVAKMLAKSFYKEMRHCGFTPNQIIHAAGEIISELTGSLNRHAKRLGRER